MVLLNREFFASEFVWFDHGHRSLGLNLLDLLFSCNLSVNP